MTLEPGGRRPESAQKLDSAQELEGTQELEGGRPEAFGAEIRAAVRYERGLVVKALAVLAVLAVLIVLRELFFA